MQIPTLAQSIKEFVTNIDENMPIIAIEQMLLCAARELERLNGIIEENKYD